MLLSCCCCRGIFLLLLFWCCSFCKVAEIITRTQRTMRKRALTLNKSAFPRSGGDLHHTKVKTKVKLFTLTRKYRELSRKEIRIEFQHHPPAKCNPLYQFFSDVSRESTSMRSPISLFRLLCRLLQSGGIKDIGCGSSS